MKTPKVLVVGAGSPNADWVSHVLNSAGVESTWTDKIRFPSPSYIRKFDVVYGIYLQTCSRYIGTAKLLGKKTIIHFVGSDAYWMSRERSKLRRSYWKLILSLTDVVLYVSAHLQGLVGRNGGVVPFPIRTDVFRRLDRTKNPRRDILYYCPSGSANERIYKLDWIMEYGKLHPQEKITIIGNPAHPAHYSIPLPNVQVIPYVNPDDMPELYRQHRRLIRMTTEDGLPRMIHEALLAGLQVIYNGEEVTEIPKEREPSEFAAALLKVLGSLQTNGGREKT